MNGIKNVTPLLMGLTNENRLETMYVKDERYGASGSQLGESVDEHGNAYPVLSEELVLAMTLDTLIETFSFPVPNHIKIDVDGIEEKILDGMKLILHRPELQSVLVEINWESSNPQFIQAVFRDAGFHDQHELNRIPNHSRHRRKNTASEKAENVIFIKK
jgi:FkbM family methyltransferase